VADGFVRRLFGASPAAPAEVQAALVELAVLARERPALAAPAALLADILPGLYERPMCETPPPMAPEHAAAKLSAGLPLLRGEGFAVDGKTFRRRWLHVCDAVQRHQGGEEGRRLAQALRDGRLDSTELTQELLAGRPETLYARAEALDLDAGLAAMVLRLTLFPVLSAVRSALETLRQGTRWNQGHCPMCGSWPLLGEFRGLEQTRFLRCGLCVAEWEFFRLRCPFCDTHEHQLLGYFHVEGEETRYRAATCEACHGYVKMLSTLAALDGPQLLVADLATTHLDLAAAKRGGQCG
jgi:FdhE protein